LKKAILQPVGKGIPAQHYAQTVEMDVALDRMRPFLSDKELSELISIYPDGKLMVWGVTPGKRNVNRTKWRRLAPGDVALFAGEGRIFSAADVTAKIQNPRLARSLWGEDESGQTWEYIYFLKNLRTVDISYARLNESLRYAPKNVIRGFQVLAESKSSRLLSILGLESRQTQNERAVLAIEAQAESDGEPEVKNEEEGKQRILAAIVRRRGQPEFRRKLLKLYNDRCAISGCDATQALEAAHIIPYSGPGTNHPANGILLRADLHTLFDLGLIAIDTAQMTVILHPELIGSSYSDLAGRKITLPKDSKQRPAVKALAEHRATSGL
jgi:hypothetical protein